jgi:twitching motility protein PilT
VNADIVLLRVHDVIADARRMRASDVHFVTGSAPAFRIDGALAAREGHFWEEAEIAAAAAVLLGDDGWRQYRASADVTATYENQNAGTVRAHAYRTIAGTAMAVRILPSQAPSLRDLGMPPAVEALAERSTGLIIFAGPTGSGKSTTMAAVAETINRVRPAHILTIEDPVEYRIAPVKAIVSQRQVGRDVASFSDAVLGALRSDPDVILVGEMRGPATIHAALTAAETGHLVLTTLHTADAPQTIDRITGSFEGSMQNEVRLRLSQTLAAVVCMRLVPLASGAGRVSAVEILIANDAVRGLIREGKAHQLRNVIATSRQSGMQTLETHLSEQLERGIIGVAAARAAALHRADLRIAERTAAI